MNVAGTLAAMNINLGTVNINDKFAHQDTTYTKDEVNYYLNDKQNALLVSVPEGGSSLIQGGVVKGIAAAVPLTLSSDASKLTLGVQSHYFERAFNAVAPLQKVLNVAAGTISLQVNPAADMTINNLTVNGSLNASGISYNPWWVAGKVDGATLSILNDKGRFPFTISRVVGIATGAYNIEWAQAHPDGSNYIMCCSGEGGGWNDLVNGVGSNLTYSDKKANVIFRKLWQNGTTGQAEGLVDCNFSFFIAA